METSDSGETIYRYWAFISYSQRDIGWAQWLHKALERYRIPRSLVDRPTSNGGIPRRLTPIFRDRDELSASSDLGQVIRNALQTSRFLVVVCSPHSAQSKWVNEEIRFFKTVRDGTRILCLIVDGEPNGDSVTQCFPEALLAQPDSTTNSLPEPLAADARPIGDGKDAALLRLIAGILGVGYDTLAQREHQRRRWQRRLAAVVSCTAIAGLVGFGWISYINRREAESRSLALHASHFERIPQKGLATAIQAAETARTIEAKHALMKALRAPLDPVILKGHDQAIQGVAFSRDGSRIATASSDRTARIWDLNGRLLQTFEGHTDALATVAFNEDATRLITSSADHTARIWDVASGRQLAQLEGHQDELFWAAFSQSGDRVFTTAKDGTARVWDAATAKELRSVKGRVYDEIVVGNQFLVVTRQPEIHVWRVDTGEELETFSAVGRWGAFSRNGRRLITLAGDPTTGESNSAAVWDIASGEQVAARDIACCVQGIPRLAPEGDYVLLPSGKEVWSIAQGKLIELADSSIQGQLSYGLFSPDGELLAARAVLDGMGNSEQFLRLWSARTGESLTSLQPDGNTPYWVAFSPDAKHIAVWAESPGSVTAAIYSLEFDALLTKAKTDLKVCFPPATDIPPRCAEIYAVADEEDS